MFESDLTIKNAFTKKFVLNSENAFFHSQNHLQ